MATPDPPWTRVERVLARPELLTIVHQPILDLRTGLAAGYEALARFPDGAAPDEWFADAHRFGLGVDLEALAVARAIADRPSDGASLTVNLGPTALMSPQIARLLPMRLDGLVIEITEHEQIDRLDELLPLIAELRRRGARFAVDDAGSGYAGFQQLMRLEPDIIKLDRDLVRGVTDDRVKASLINAIVRFADSIDATVCAEGIEDLGDLTEVAELGVALGQGWAIARPGAGWPAVAPEAVGACRLSLADALRPTSFETQATDRRMASIASAASSMRTMDDAVATLDLIARELNAEHVCLSSILDGGAAVQTVVANDDFDGGTIYPLDHHPLTTQVLRTGDMVQVRSTDPEADSAELDWMIPEGFQRLIMAPVVLDGEAVALFEVCGRTPRPWNRAEIYRARVICQLLAPSIRRIIG